jgi:hypothetical protein
MPKKNLLPVIFLVALVAVYVIYFTDWFKPHRIHIFHTVREVRYRQAAGQPERSLIFGVDPRDIRLTEIKVVPLLDFEKNPQTLPVWHLVSDSNSVPVRQIVYGQRIRGMRPVVGGEQAGELDTNLDYRIFITAGRNTGQHDFRLGNTPSQTEQNENP